MFTKEQTHKNGGSKTKNMVLIQNLSLPSQKKPMSQVCMDTNELILGSNNSRSNSHCSNSCHKNIQKLLIS